MLTQLGRERNGQPWDCRISQLGELQTNQPPIPTLFEERVRPYWLARTVTTSPLFSALDLALRSGAAVFLVCSHRFPM